MVLLMNNEEGIDIRLREHGGLLSCRKTAPLERFIRYVGQASMMNRLGRIQLS